MRYALCAVRCALWGDFCILMDLRFAHMHKQHSHSIIRSFEPLSLCDLHPDIHSARDDVLHVRLPISKPEVSVHAARRLVGTH